MTDDRPLILRGLLLATAVAIGVGLLANSTSSVADGSRDDDSYAGYADRPRDHDRHAARRLEEAGRIQGLEEILAAAREQRPGRVLEVELEYEHGAPRYEVVVLDDAGVVWELELDAASAAVLKQEREHP